MKTTQITLSILLASLLVLQGCGGGGGSGSSAPAATGNLGEVEVPQVSEERLALYNAKIEEFSNEAATSHARLDRMLSKVSDGYTVMPDTSTMTAARTAQLFESLNADLPEYARLLLVANEVVTVESQLRREDGIQKARPRILGILLTGVAIGMAGLYKFAIDANNERTQIVVKAIANADQKELKEFNEALGLDPDAPKAKTLAKFNNMSFREVIAKRKTLEGIITAHVAETGDDHYATQLKEQAVRTVRKSGKVAVTTVVGQLLNAAGGQGVDKAISGAARMMGASAAEAEIIGATADLVISAKGKQPLDLLAEHLTVVGESREYAEEQIEAAEAEVKEAIETLQRIVKEGKVPEGLGMDTLADAANALMRNVALKSGRGKKNADGSVTVKVPEREVITTAKNVRNGKTKIPVREMLDGDLIISAKGMVPEIVRDQFIFGETEIEIEDKPVKAVEQGMTATATKIASDSDSITYRVSVTLTGITAPTTVRIDVSNASTSGSTKTISKDGTLTWNVTVLSKDGGVTITRDDTGKSSYLPLRGTGNAPTGEYVAVFVGNITSAVYNGPSDGWDTCESERSEIGKEGWPLFVDSSGNVYEELGDSPIGTITGTRIDITLMGDHFTGSISSGNWNDGQYCDGKYKGHFATLSELYQYKNSCSNDSECRNGPEYDAILSVIDYAEAEAGF